MAIVKWNNWGWPVPFLEEDWPTLTNWEDFSKVSKGIDLYETENSVVVEAQIPGIKEDNVEITLEGNVITINAKQEETQEEKDKKRTVYKSTRQTSFNYSTNLPRIVDTNKAEAEIADGIVKVTIPKMENEKPKKIEIKKKIKG